MPGTFALQQFPRHIQQKWPGTQCTKQPRSGGSTSGGSTSSRSRLLRGGPVCAAEGSFEASATVERCLQLFSESNLDGIVEFLPDAVVDRCLQKKKDKLITAPFKDLSFADLLDLSTQGDFHMDAYAQRGLILSPPGASTLLSSLHVSEEEFLQRYAIAAASGEQMIITFRLQLEDSLVFLRSATTIRKEWFLRGITGEPALPDLPTQPARQWGPETVVQAQLEALRENDLPTVYRFASPQSQLLAQSYERFVAMLGNAVYRPLVGHREAAVLRSVQMARDKACVVVGISSDQPPLDISAPQRSVYAWVLRLQDSRQGSGLANCWLVEGVHPFTSRLYTI